MPSILPPPAGIFPGSEAAVLGSPTSGTGINLGRCSGDPLRQILPSPGHQSHCWASIPGSSSWCVPRWSPREAQGKVCGVTAPAREARTPWNSGHPSLPQLWLQHSRGWIWIHPLLQSSGSLCGLHPHGAGPTDGAWCRMRIPKAQSSSRGWEHPAPSLEPALSCGHALGSSSVPPARP